MNLIKYIQNVIHKLLNAKDVRNRNAIKNIFFSLNIKGISILISLIQLPITLNYIGNEQYGIWITLSSVFAWINLFDIGLGNGLRNKFTEALALNDVKKAKIYVSTTYAIIISIITVFIICYSFINEFINWSKIFNCSPALIPNLNLIVLVSVISVAIQFVLRLINVMLIADQKPALNDAITLLYSIIVTISVFLLPKDFSNKFFLLILVFTVIPLIVSFASSIYFFSTRFRLYRPSVKYINFSYSSDLIGLGFNFFILQIAGLFMFSLTNILISQFLNPLEVTVYNVAFRYINVGILVFSIVLTPYWNAFTDAYAKGELSWIKSTNRKLVKVWGLFSICILVMIIFSPFVYKIWTRNQVVVPFLLSLFIGLFAIINNWTGLFLCLINGTGKVRVQIIYAVMTMLIVFPLTYVTVKILNLGVVGFGMSLFLYNIGGAIISFIQYNKIVNGIDDGIWSK